MINEYFGVLRSLGYIAAISQPFQSEEKTCINEKLQMKTDLIPVISTRLGPFSIEKQIISSCVLNHLKDINQHVINNRILLHEDEDLTM